MSLFGYELWPLCSYDVNDICVARCKSVRRAWNLPFNAHNYITYLQLICHCLPIFDEICRRCVHFSYECAHCGSFFIRSITYGIFYGRDHSLIWRNITFCLHRFNCSIAGFTSGRPRYFIDNSWNACVSQETWRKATFVEECIYDRHLLQKDYFKTILCTRH